MKHILTMKSSKQIELLDFQIFMSRTFLDNLLLKKRSRRQFIFLFTPVRHYHLGRRYYHSPNCIYKYHD